MLCDRWLKIGRRRQKNSATILLTHHPFYLRITMDCTLSYKEHLQKTASKLKSHHSLLMKLAGSSWGTNAETLRSSTLALCYSAAEYCAPVWSHSAHTGLIDVQLNTSMWLIWSGTLCTTPLPRLPVLANEPRPSRRKAASAKLMEKGVLMTAGQFTVIYWYFMHHDSDCHPGVNCGKILIEQQTSQVSGGKTGIGLRWPTPT